MEWELILAFSLLLFGLISFLLEKVSIDTTALVLLGAILIVASTGVSEKWPSLNEVLSVFANEAPITIAAMFVISTSQIGANSLNKYLSRWVDFVNMAIKNLC